MPRVSRSRGLGGFRVRHIPPPTQRKGWIGTKSSFATVTGEAAVTGSGAISATALHIEVGAAAVAGAGAISVTAVRVKLGAASVAGAGAWSATGARGGVGAASVTGSGAWSATGTRVKVGAAALAGSGLWSATGNRLVIAYHKLVRDSFTRADSSTIGTSDSGHTWTETGGAAFAIASNKLSIDPLAEGGQLSIDSGLTACEVEVTIDYTPPADGLGLKIAELNQNEHLGLLLYQEPGPIYHVRLFLLNLDDGHVPLEEVDFDITGTHVWKLRANVAEGWIEGYADGELIVRALLSGPQITRYEDNDKQGLFFSSTPASLTFDDYSVAPLTHELDGTGVISASGVVVQLASANVAGSGAWQGSANVYKTSGASVVGGGVFVATGKRIVLGVVAVAGNGAWAALGVGLKSGVVAWVGAGVISSGGHIVTVFSGESHWVISGVWACKEAQRYRTIIPETRVVASWSENRSLGGAYMPGKSW